MKKIKFTNKSVEAYTEVDLINDLTLTTKKSKQECKLFVEHTFELLKNALLEHEGILIRKFCKFSKNMTRTKVWFHPQEDFAKLKSGEIKNISDLPPQTKYTKPFYRVKITLSGDLKEKLRNRAYEDFLKLPDAEQQIVLKMEK